MNAGKSLEILKIANNYEEQNKKVLLFNHHLDTRYGKGVIGSRVGIKREAHVINDDTDLEAVLDEFGPVQCILIDEGQFLNLRQVLQLADIVDRRGVPVIVYGLKNDFQNNLFPGSIALLTYADKIEEIKTICWYCNRKATMNMRVFDDRPVEAGEQIMVGGNESYMPVCRKCYNEAYRKLREERPQETEDSKS